MERRSFLEKTSAGLAAVLIAPNTWTCIMKKGKKKPFEFRSYRPGKTMAKVTCITPDDGFYLHTFYDVCPWSPTQRFLAVTKFPYQKKKPQWGDTAEVCIIDLENQTIETIYKTKAWSYQLGANVQWGKVTDSYLYTNDIIGGKPVCIRINLENGDVRAYSGAKYDIAPDEKSVISPNLLNMNIHQYGYAVPDGSMGRPVPFTKEDMPREGLWKTNLETNETKLLVSFPQFLEKVEGPENDKTYYQKSINYLFHSKFNNQGTRIMQVFRGLIDNEGRDASLFTLDVDGSNLKQCLTREKWNQKARLGGSGNHPNWHPDGEHIIMNCIPRWLGYEDMLFCMFRYDGSDFRVLSEKHLGSGHPSVAPATRYLIADAYAKQTYVVEGEEVPIRLIDLENDEEHTLCTISNDVGGGGNAYLPIDKKLGGSPHKLDPHPAWSRDYQKVCVNGAPKGRRQVFIIDLKGVI